MEPIRFTMAADAHLLRHVLFVEYPAALAALAVPALKAAAMDVEIAGSLAEAAHLLERFQPGVVLLYAAGSPPAGLERIGVLARGGECGVIVVLEQDSEAARIAALDQGADHVLPRTVRPGELAAHVRAVLRRGLRSAAMPAYEPGAAILLEPAHRCVVGPHGERTPLSEAEFIALETLLDADGAPVSREWLGRVALKRPLHSEDRSVDQLVLKLRRKLAAAGATERTILAARRQGYVIPDPTRFRSIGALPHGGESGRQLVGAR